MRINLKLRYGIALALAAGFLFTTTPTRAADKPVATFSIVALDPKTGDLGVGVQSRYFAVGSVVPHAKAGIGAIATQALGKLSYGRHGLELLSRKIAPGDALQKMLAEDKAPESRQVGIVDAQGRTVSHTGADCLPWAGGRTGKNYAAQGNILTGPEVVDAMAKTFEKTTGDLAHRIMASLRAAQAAGGDKRGRQSAALLIVRKNGGYNGENDRYIDLHVEDHPEPIEELARLLRIKRSQRAAIETDRLLNQLKQATTLDTRESLLAGAIEHAERAVRLNIRDDWAWLLLARARLQSNKPAAAARAGTKALQLNPALKAMRPKTRAVLGLDEQTLERLLMDNAFRRLWDLIPETP